MLVYGDPEFEASLTVLAPRLYSCVSEVQYNNAPTLDQVRSLLIRAGQMEQAVEDSLALLPASSAAEIASACRAVTDAAARAFLAAWGRTQLPVRFDHIDLFEALRETAEAAQVIEIVHAPLKVVVPKGFGIDAVFPEQYIVSAWKWIQAQDHETRRPVAVVGIRSIGTTLSAVVRAVLETHDWTTTRLTICPSENPGIQAMEIEIEDFLGAEIGIVAGGGLADSSMAMVATAQALQDLGISPGDISLMSGEAIESGALPSPPYPHYVTTQTELLWNGRPLIHCLEAESRLVLKSHEPAVEIEDLSAGQWRAVCYERESDWPSVPLAFERAKYRVTLRNGSRVMWKFTGLAATSAQSAFLACFGPQPEEHPNQNWCAPILGSFSGFQAFKWVSGTRLTKADADPNLLRQLGQYISDVARPVVGPDELERAHVRLSKMLTTNTEASLGPKAAERARAWAKLARMESAGFEWLAYGDGRMAPYEWICTESGELVKTDCGGHDMDHTIIGRQPFIWDVAGTIVEWELDDSHAAPLIEFFGSPGTEAIPPTILNFYRMCYAAFRLGQFEMSRYVLDSPEELSRTAAACDFYRSQLAQLLSRHADQ